MPVAVLLLDPETRTPARILRGAAAHLPDYYERATATPPTAILYTEDGSPVRPPVYEIDDAGRKTATGEGDPIPTHPIAELPADPDAVKYDTNSGRIMDKTKAERSTDKAEKQARADLAAAHQAREALIRDRIARDTRAAAIASLIADGDLNPDGSLPRNRTLREP